MKKFLSKYKNIFFGFIIIVLFILLVGLVAFFMQKDKERYSNIDVSDSIQLNTSWSINSDGNLVGNNLLPIGNNVYNYDNESFAVYNSFTFNFSSLNLPLGTYTISYFYNQNVSSLVGLEVKRDYAFWQGTNSGGLSGVISLDFTISDNSNYTIYFFTNYSSNSITKNLSIYNIMLNTGSSRLDYEPYGVWYSSDNYNSVVNDYNNLNNDVIKFNNYGMLAYLDYMEITIGSDNYYYNDNEDTEMSFDYCVSQGFIQSGGLLNLSYFTGSTVNPNYYTISAYLSFDYDKIFVSQFNLSFDSSVIASIDVDFYGFSYNTPIPTSDSSYSILSSELLDLASENQSNSSLASISINFNSAESVGLVNFNSISAVSFNNGYQKGYSTASNVINSTYLPQIDTLNTTISDLENQLDTLTDNYNTLNTNFSNLQAQYQELLGATEYSMSELFWSISAVPFGVLTSAFNVDVLGVNLRGIITGLFTSLLLIWLIKKFL